MTDYQNFHDEFFALMQRRTKPPCKTFWDKLINPWKFGDRIASDVYKFYSAKLKNIFQYIKEQNLVTETEPWDYFSLGVYLLATVDPQKLVLPEDLKIFVVKQFEGKKITLKKINGAYTVVFDN